MDFDPVPKQVNSPVQAITLAEAVLKAESEENKIRLAKQTYDLALLSQNMLSGTDLTNFIKRSIDLVG